MAFLFLPIDPSIGNPYKYIGNVIATDAGDYLFIDMADFCYGDPRFDIAMQYLVSHEISEKRAHESYHTNMKVLGEFWVSFVKYYTGDASEENLRKFDKDLTFFVCMRLLYISWMTGWQEFMCIDCQRFFKRFIENE